MFWGGAGVLYSEVQVEQLSTCLGGSSGRLGSCIEKGLGSYTEESQSWGLYRDPLPHRQYA